jgi:hypothetical protein
VEIIDWLDDHSRLLLSLTAFHRVTGGKNAFEYLLATLRVQQKTATPATPRPRARSSASTQP